MSLRMFEKEADICGGIRNIPSSSFMYGGYRYARTSDGYAKYLITRDKPRGRRHGARISVKEFCSAWLRRKK